MGYEFKLAWRALARTPGVFAAMVCSIAIGIGVNAAAFMGMNALTLNPLPFPDLDRIMTLWEAASGRIDRDPMAPANLLDWQEQSRSFDHVAAARSWYVVRTSGGRPEPVRGVSVTPSFFKVLGIAAFMGRSFTDDDVKADALLVVVSHSFWQSRLAADPNVIGSTTTLNGHPHVIVGVMPPQFDFPMGNDIWQPLVLTPVERADRVSPELMAFGLLKPDVTIAQARAEATSISAGLATRFPVTNGARRLSVRTLREMTNTVTDRFTVILFATAGFVLLLACANVAALLLARSNARAKEYAVHTALGSAKQRIALGLLAETLLIAVPGAALGLALASWNTAWTRATIPDDVVRSVAGLRWMSVDSSTVLFTVGLSLLVAAVCAAPSLVHVLRRVRASQLNITLGESGRNSGSRRRRYSRNLLVVTEVVLALTLLIGAGLMVTTFDRMLNANPGFDTRNLLTMRTNLPSLDYPDDVAIRSYVDRLVTGISSLPQTRMAAAYTELRTPPGLYLEGRPDPTASDLRPRVRAVTGQYFASMGLPIVGGRGIGDQDSESGQPVAVVSEAVARSYWPSGSPIGAQIRLQRTGAATLTVVGVSGDYHEWFTGVPVPTVYVSFAQSPRRATSVIVRTAGDPLQVATAVGGQSQAIDPNVPLLDVRSMEQVISEETSGVRVAAISMSSYAGIALLLAIVGVYSVMSYTVSQRQREFAIRMALGAGGDDIKRMVFGNIALIALVGILVGLPAAFALADLMSSLLFGVVSVEMWTFAGATLVLGLAVVCAGYGPARRAARLQPSRALQNE